MPFIYNPIVRTFCRFRGALLRSADVPRRDVRPRTPLSALLPSATRREVWHRLQRHGLPLPDLQLSARDARRMVVGVLVATLVLTFALRSSAALLLALPLGCVGYRLSRPRAVEFPLGLGSVGELVIYLTRFRDHSQSRYRWTRSEIALKVRLIVAEQMGLPLDAVQPDHAFVDDLGAD